MVEFTLICIPLIFFTISIVELSRGMWIYSTVAHAIKSGTRYTAIHGAACASMSSACTVTVADVAAKVRNSGTGLDATQMSVVLKSAHTTLTCSPLSTCLGNSTAWPPSTDNDVGQSVSISGSYPFRSALAMFWPGAGGMRVGMVNLGAKSQEEITF